MKKSLVLSLALFFVLFALSSGAPVANAASKQVTSKTTTQIINRPVTWSMTPAQCSNLKIQVDASGKWHEVITTITRKDGSQRILDNSFAEGTATDANGGTYIFVYGNNLVSVVPSAGSPVKVNMGDTFVLNQTNGNNDLREAFKWKWTYNPPDANWPPNDNWQQIYTIGDPLHCDPI